MSLALNNRTQLFAVTICSFASLLVSLTFLQLASCNFALLLGFRSNSAVTTSIFVSLLLSLTFLQLTSCNFALLLGFRSVSAVTTSIFVSLLASLSFCTELTPYNFALMLIYFLFLAMTTCSFDLLPVFLSFLQCHILTLPCCFFSLCCLQLTSYNFVLLLAVLEFSIVTSCSFASLHLSLTVFLLLCYLVFL